MRLYICFSLALMLLFSCTRKSDYENKVDRFRNQTIEFYLTPKETPLDSNELKNFNGIHYYDIDKSYKTEATIIWLPQTMFVDMPLTNGKTRPYMKVAELHFQLNGTTHTLSAYQKGDMQAKHELFVPFNDETNGDETYGGGRYVDVIYNPASSKAEIDFNFAYLPYCAYTHHSACAMVPRENTLATKVRAGERMGK